MHRDTGRGEELPMDWVQQSVHFFGAFHASLVSSIVKHYVGSLFRPGRCCNLDALPPACLCYLYHHYLSTQSAASFSR